MCSMTRSTVCVLVLTAIATGTVAGNLQAQSTTRVSVDSLGAQADNGSSQHVGSVLSADGQFLAFDSEATNLVPGDTNGTWDIFVHDRLTGATTRVNVSSSGEQANGWSGLDTSPAVSADGRFVAFTSSANNLVPGDTNSGLDVFVHDRQLHETTRVSVKSQGGQVSSSSRCGGISADGRRVVFTSWADDLVLGDTNGSADVFVHDRQSGETVRVSVDSQGRQAHGTSNLPAISADGRFVAFTSDAKDLVPDDTNGMMDIFVHDLQTGDTTRVSVNSHGKQENGISEFPAISADGRCVAFASRASNLVHGDTNDKWDVFVHDVQTGMTTRVSVNWQGSQGNLDSSSVDLPAISASGRYVAFQSWATNLVSGDTNQNADVFVHDRETGRTTRASVDSLGGQADSRSDFPAISADGRFLAFTSWSTNLVPGDTNGCADVFVRELDDGPCSLPASWTSYGSGWPGTLGIPSLVAKSNPLLCMTVEVCADNSYGSDSVGLLMGGLASFAFGTPWGGTVFVRPDLVMVMRIPASGLSLPWPIPCEENLCGIHVFAQLLELDPGAAYGVSFTPGLDLGLGVQ